MFFTRFFFMALQRKSASQMCFKFFIIKWFEHETEFQENTHSTDLQPRHTLTHSHTQTLTLCCVFKELCVFFAVSHSVCFALRPREHTRIRIHKSLSAYEQEGRGRGGQHTHTHTHTLQLDTAAISSYQEITTNLQVPHKCLTKSFVKSFHWFRNISTISVPR